MNLPNHFSRQHPFLASIKERYTLCKENSDKETMHVVLDLEGVDFPYEVGDSIGVFPSNNPLLVERVLHILKASGKEIVKDKKGESFTLNEFLTFHVNLKGISRKFFQELLHRLPEEKKKDLETLLLEDHKEALKTWLHSHELWDLLETYPEALFKFEDIAQLAMPLLPRFYSIASSQNYVKNEIHLLVAHLKYKTRDIARYGVCTHYLCQLAPLHEKVVPIYLHPSHEFKLPKEKDIPIIMIGPGTGVAPFRAFMQEREKKGDKGPNWLFFGERTQKNEFFYEEEWKRWESMGLLTLDLAFSRDQTHKVYVQHKMKESGKKIMEWLKSGAYLYVCGDAHGMAKDVEKALHEIFMEHGHLKENEAFDYLKQLKHEKRYLRDVY